MLGDAAIKELEPRFKVYRIICGAMIFGSVSMLGVLLFVKTAPLIDKNLDPVAWVGIGMAACCIPASLLVFPWMRKQMVGELASQVKQKGKEDQGSDSSLLIPAFTKIQSAKIVQYALLQGPAFANILLWFVDHCAFNLIAYGVCLSLQLLMFPMTNSVISQIEDLIAGVENQLDGF